MNSRNRKIVFFDVDGTIIDSPTHQIPDSTAEAIRRLRANGHLAFLNTGRTLASIEKRIQDIGFDGYVCGCGTHIYYEGETLYASSIPHEKCVDIIYTLRRLGIPTFFEAEEAVYYDSRCMSPELGRSVSNFHNVGSRVCDFPDRPEESGVVFDKFFCLLRPDSDEAALRAYAGSDYTVTPQGPGNLEIVPAGRSKAEGIRFLQEKFGIPDGDCYAIGDSENDLPMLKAVPNSIAMGVCAEAILPYCSYRTGKVLEDGIRQALEHYKLI
ncbi:MAG: HAD family hydrolase [Eubacteriales bacterium]|nr:HAD family hydrolase [Eubacteriales bacterium]